MYVQQVLLIVTAQERTTGIRRRKEGGCLPTSIVMEIIMYFVRFLAHLFQLEEFYLAIDKELALFKEHTDSFLASLTSSAEKLKATQSSFWKMPLPV